MTGYERLALAIERKCVDCSGSLSQAKACTMRDCPLWDVAPWHHRRPSTAQRKKEGRQVRMVIRDRIVIEIK